jgi:hypothetical protein
LDIKILSYFNLVLAASDGMLGAIGAFGWSGSSDSIKDLHYDFNGYEVLASGSLLAGNGIIITLSMGFAASSAVCDHTIFSVDTTMSGNHDV